MRSNAIQRRLAAGPLKRAPTNPGNHRTVVSTVGERRLNSQLTAVNDGSTPGVALLLSQRPANGVLTAVPLERRHRDLRQSSPLFGVSKQVFLYFPTLATGGGVVHSGPTRAQ